MRVVEAAVKRMRRQKAPKVIFVDVTNARKSKQPGRRVHAFTLVELLVVIAIIALLAALQLPALAKAERKSQAIQCMNGHRQLLVAWLAYQGDYQGKFPPNADADTADTGPSWVQGILGWPGSGSPGGNGGLDNTNLNYLVNNSQSLLGSYCGKNPGVYKCPADTWLCSINNQLLPRVRSRSMNGYVDGLYSPSLDNWDSTLAATWRVYAKASDVLIPGPSALSVFVDEHPDSINDGWFITLPGIDQFHSPGYWEDPPAGYHNGACGFGFADGHAAIHKWLSGRTCAPVLQAAAGDGSGRINGLISDSNPVDLLWMVQHSSAPINGAVQINN
jgi:prepilin-type N-terminal cleavage/methylation domain-containing protein/prepilin-type processing-associated H-X9-DG protein